MRATLAWLFLILSAFITGESPSRVARGETPNGCEAIKKALESAEHIKTGMTRRDVEKNFERDGGMQFPSPTRYSYPECHYIKIDVEFQNSPLPSKDELLSPTDIVLAVSKPYLEYPVKD